MSDPQNPHYMEEEPPYVPPSGHYECKLGCIWRYDIKFVPLNSGFYEFGLVQKMMGKDMLLSKPFSPFFFLTLTRC